ncbi:hypothetical protein D3C73_1357450 [compost metagenome]
MRLLLQSQRAKHGVRRADGEANFIERQTNHPMPRDLCGGSGRRAFIKAGCAYPDFRNGPVEGNGAGILLSQPKGAYPGTKTGFGIRLEV